MLRAYEDAIAEGRLARDQVITLAPKNRSLPSGVLQHFPEGTPVTLESVATLMIQQSDNTATDALIHLLGRQTLEAMSPRKTPFLTTAEAFKLKAKDAAALRASFVDGDEREKRERVDALADRPLPSSRELEPGATWSIEWFFSARELCDLARSLAQAPALASASLSPVNTDGWQWLGYKGGSEFGVLNHTAAGRRVDGTSVCLSVTANDTEALPQDRITLLFASLFNALR